MILGFNCLKNNRNILKKIFENQQHNTAGVYYVKLFVGNIWKYVIIDDYIPVI